MLNAGFALVVDSFRFQKLTNAKTETVNSNFRMTEKNDRTRNNKIN